MTGAIAPVLLFFNSMILFATIFFYCFQGNTSFPVSAEAMYEKGDSSYYEGNYLDAKNHYLAAYQLYQLEGDSVGISRSLNDAGISYQNLGVLDSAIFYYFEALAWDEARNDTLKMATRYINIGNTFKTLGRYTKGVEAFLTAAALANRDQGDKVQARAYNGIGNLYLDQDEPEKAIEYYKRAYRIHEMNNHSLQSLAIVLGNIGSAYFMLGELDSAFHFSYRALAIKKTTNRRLSLAYTQEELGRFHLTGGDMDSANFYFEASLRIRQGQLDLQGIASVSLNQARYFLKNNQASNAYEKVKVALDYAQKFGDRELRLACLEALVTYFELKQNWKEAYTYRTHWAALRDSIFNAEKLQVQEILADQQIQEKEQERLLSYQQARLAEAESREQRQNARNNLLIAGVMAVFFVSAGVGLFKIRKLNHKLSRSHEKIKLLNQQNMHFTKNALSEITSLLNFQSKKLEGVAKELMQGARLRLDTINILYSQLFTSGEREESLVNLAMLTHNILENTLEALLSEDLQPATSFELQPVEVSSDVALSMGLIANELCINACKYAFDKPNKRLDVSLQTEPERIIFTFQDTGPGLPQHLKWQEVKSFGLQLIALLVEDMNGRLNIENCSPGLKIELAIPNH